MDLIDQLPCAVLVTDGQGRVLACNADLRALAASPACVLEGAPMEGLFSVPSRIFLQTHCWPTLLRQGRLSEAFLYIRSATEQVMPVLLNSRCGTYDGGVGYYWTLFVATERQRFESAVLDARQRAEHAARSLAISERFTRSVTDSIPSLVVYWDKDLRCRFANKAYLEWFGQGADALLGSHLQELRDGTLYRANEVHILAALRGEVQHFEHLMTQANGEAGHVWATYVPEVVEGVVQGFLVVVSDVTHMKQAEAALRAEIQAREAAHALLSRSNAALKQAQRLGRIGSWAWQVQSDVVSWSDELFQILGCDPAQGTPGFAAQAKLYEPDSYARLQQVVQGALQTGEPYALELICRLPDGGQRWVEARGEVLHDAAGQLTGLQGTVQDITERKNSETALATEGLRLANIIEATQAGTWEWNVQTGQVKLNQRSAAMLGYALEELGEQTVQQRLDQTHPDDRHLSVAAAEQHLAGLTEVYESEARMRHRDGHWVWVLARGRVMTRTSAGEPEWMFGTHLDISERRQLDQRLAARTAELKRSNEELERFAYVASHDLQEPLRMVTSYGQLLMRRHLASLNPEAQTFIQYMVDGGQRAQALIRDLLSLARLDSQAQPWQPLSLNDAVADALKQLRLRVQETAAAVTVDELPTVMADARQIGQLMGN